MQFLCWYNNSPVYLFLTCFTQGDSDTAMLKKVSQALGCDTYLTLHLQYMDKVNHCIFPGSGVYTIAQKLYIIQRDFATLLADSNIRGWVSSYNIKYNYASPLHIHRTLQRLSR